MKHNARFFINAILLIGLLSCQTTDMAKHIDYGMQKEDGLFENGGIFFNRKVENATSSDLDISLKGKVHQEFSGLWTIGSTSIRSYVWQGDAQVGKRKCPLTIHCAFSIDPGFGKEISQISIDSEPVLFAGKEPIGGLATKIPFTVIGIGSETTTYAVELTVDPYWDIGKIPIGKVSYDKLQALVFEMQKFQVLDSANRLIGEMQGDQYCILKDLPESERNEIQVVLSSCKAIQALGRELMQLRSDTL
jgi:hypothetical protein